MSKAINFSERFISVCRSAHRIKDILAQMQSGSGEMPLAALRLVSDEMWQFQVNIVQLREQAQANTAEAAALIANLPGMPESGGNRTLGAFAAVINTGVDKIDGFRSAMDSLHSAQLDTLVSSAMVTRTETHVDVLGQSVELSTPLTGRCIEERLAIPSGVATTIRGAQQLQDAIDALAAFPEFS